MAFEASIVQISAGVNTNTPPGCVLNHWQMLYITGMAKQEGENQKKKIKYERSSISPKKIKYEQSSKAPKKVHYKETTKGLVIVYTGEGKGKTTAALGLVLRAAGYKRKVLIVQFGKVWFTGELEGVKKLAPYVKIIQGGLGFVKIFDDHSPLSEHIKVANKTYDYLYKEVTKGKWDMVVADEIVGAVAGKLLKHSQVAKLIKDKPEKLDLILTGHHGKKNLFKLADLVTEMTPIKHPFEKGFLAKPGIDY